MANQIRMTPDTMRTRAKETDNQEKAVSDVIRYMDKLLQTLKGEWEGDAVRVMRIDITKSNLLSTMPRNCWARLHTISEKQQELSKKQTRTLQVSSESNFQHVEATTGCCFYKTSIRRC